MPEPSHRRHAASSATRAISSARWGDIVHAALAAAEAVPELLAFVGPDERYRYANAAHERWLGRPADELLGRTLREALGDALYAALGPHLEAARRDGCTVTAVAPVVAAAPDPRADDAAAASASVPPPAARHVRVTCAPRMDRGSGALEGIALSVADVTAECAAAARAERLLAQSEQRAAEHRRAEESLRFLAEASAALGASLDYARTLASVARLAVPRLADWCAVDIREPDGTVRRVASAHANPRRAALDGALEQRVLGRPDAPHGPQHVIRTGEPELFADLSPASPALADLATEDATALAALRALGLRSAMCVPLRARGEVLGAITFVTARESGRAYGAEDLAVALDLARRAGVAVDNARLLRDAQEANRIRDEFLSTVSHELRTPLTAIVGWTWLLESRAHDPAMVARAVATIQRNARAQAQLIEDLLDVSRIVTGKLRVEVRPVDLAAVVRAALDTVRPTAEAREVHLHAELPPGVVTVNGDPDRLQQVAWNLLANAVKFTPHGGRVAVALRTDGAFAELSVTDTGVGIRPEVLPFIFDRFRQGDSSTTRAYGGLGLGLAIVRHLVDVHGGTVAAESSGEGQGATFRVRLPLRAARESGDEGSPSVRPPPPPVVGPDAAASLSGVTVLVVDDQADAREVVATVLAQCGARVDAVGSAADALARYDAGPPDVLVCDIAMPDVDGYELLRAVRARDQARGALTPAVALTAYARPEDAREARRAGFQSHLAKPVQPGELARVVARLAGARQALAGK